MTRSGYKCRTVSGNIAWGLEAAGLARRHLRVLDEQFRPYKANILNSEFGDIGVGAASDPYKGHGDATMCSANFGAR